MPVEEEECALLACGEVVATYIVYIRGW
jgi:hypothetical protein